MRVLSIEFGQVTWIVDLSLPSGTLYFPEAIKKINERYGFVQFPNLNDLLGPQTKVEFGHGKFDDLVIRKFSIHTDGLIAESQAGTTAAAKFLDDILKWVHDEFGAVPLDINESYRVYDSHLIVQMDLKIGERVEFLQFITSELDTKLNAYGLEVPNYEFDGFSLSADNARTAGLSTSQFRLDRRVGQPFKNNTYYATAPLRIEDHVKLLERIEKSI